MKNGRSRPPSKSLGPGWNHVVRGGRVKAASPPSHNHATGPLTEQSIRHEVTATSRNGRTEKSAPKVTVGPKQAPVIEEHQENKRSYHTSKREAGGSSNGQQLGNKRHCPNLPPRLNKLTTSPAKQKFATPSAKQKIITEMAYFRSCKLSSATSNSLISLFPILINFIVLCTVITISLRHRH